MTNAMRAGVSLIVFAIALTFYIFTLTPSVGLVDSGELTVAAWSLGNAHPPGFPLFIILTHLFALLPVGSVAWRCNLASAFFSAAAAAFVALAVGEMLSFPTTVRTAEPSRKRDRRKAPSPVPIPDVSISTPVAAAIMIVAGLLFAFSKTVWAYATETEVYALNSALMAAISWLMLLWARTRNSRILAGAALVFGLALGVHHVTIGLGAVAIAVLLTRTAGWPVWRSRQAVVGALFIVAGLFVYAYLPMAASRAPAMNWGNPVTARRVYEHFTAAPYRAYLSSEATSTSAQFDRYTSYLTREFGPPWLPLALLIAAFGIVMLWRRQRTLFWYVILLLLADCAWVFFYPVKNDQDAYVIPSFLAVVLAFGYGANAMARQKPSIAAAMGIVPLIALITAYPLRDRSRFWVAKDYTTNALRIMQPKALLITGDWEMYSPMRYVLDVEKPRTDVAIIESGFLFSNWYHEELDRRYPDLMRACRAESRAVLSALQRFDADHSLWQDAEARRELNDRVDDLLIAFVSRHLQQRRPVYATIDTALAWDSRDKAFIKRLSAAYDIVPRGIVAEVMSGHAVRDIQPTPMLLRGLIDGTVRYEDDDVVPTEILPKYRAAFLIRARYFTLVRRLKEAVADYQQAAALDPENWVVQRELAAVEARYSPPR